MSRSKYNQTKHDALVRKLAQNYQKRGFDVEADIRGFPQPDTIGGYRPDIIAQKDKQRKIAEVETLDSLDAKRDKQQEKAFRNAADRNKNTTFIKRITK